LKQQDQQEKTPKTKKKKNSLSISQSNPSFDLNNPYIPGRQNYQGIPNATPEMLRRLQQRKMNNPGGQRLPVIVRPV
jgi:hypothetical protein